MIEPEGFDGRKFTYLRQGALAIVGAYEKYEDPEYYAALISEMCWQIASVDLKNAQIVISACRAGYRVTSLPEGVRVALDGSDNEYKRHVNSKLDEKFNLIASWFERPKISVPSVDLGTLLRVVHGEVSEEFSAYTGADINSNSEEITLTGTAYHIAYDFLYVALKNAAEHGRQNGDVTVDVNVAYESEVISALTMTVRSEYPEGVNLAVIEKEISDCKLDSLDSAYVEEGKSGLRKVKRLESDWVEVISVDISPNAEFFEVSMTLGFIK